MVKQNSLSIWLTGISGSGKTTISNELKSVLKQKGFNVIHLDGDSVRSGLCKDLGFTDKDRFENIRRVSEFSKLLISNNIITINSFIAPQESMRNLAKEIIGENNFVEIYVKASVSKCEKNDVKGLYRSARKGYIKNFTGITSIYEPPLYPQLTLNTDEQSVEECVACCLDVILPKIKVI